jgi:chromosome segregation ATPase
MDDRKRTIREYEDKKREALDSIEVMLENLGASLLSLSEQDVNSDYGRLNRDINDSEVYIAAIEEDIARLKAVEEDILRKDQEIAARSKDLSLLYTRLGESVLEEGDCIDAIKPYQGQAETLYSRIKSLEERLDQLEDRSDGNVFTWIGKNTQGVVLRSFLGKSRGNLQKIYAVAGEKYSQFVSAETETVSSTRSLLKEIDSLKKEAAVLSSGLASLKEERRRINDAFIPDGGPTKKIQVLERHIAHAREELQGVFLRYGREIEDADSPSSLPPMGETETQLLEDIRKNRQVIREYDREIEKLKASLAIDEEKAAIAKMEKAIKDHEGRIRAGEEAIASLTSQIRAANIRIEELTKVL